MRVKYILMLSFVMSFSVLCRNQSFGQDIQQDTINVKHSKVVSVAYGSQADWSVSTAISSVKGDDLRKSFTSNLANTLYGRLPGLTVRQGLGEPGNDSPTLNIRGVNTFGAAATGILIMVDGFESTFEQIAVDEIESVSILKDAASTAIYGNRGANGVMLITTKRGIESPLKINFSAQYGLQYMTSLPPFLKSYDYANLYNEALANDGKPALYTSDDLEAYRTGSDPYFHPNVNWYKEVLREAAPIANYDLNFSGGTKVVRYFVLLNALKSDGLYEKTGNISDNSKNASYSRFNFRSNVDINLTKRLSASLTLGGTIEDKATPAGNNSSSMFNLMSSTPPNAFPVYTPNGLYGGSQLYANPLGNALETGFYSSNGRTLQTTFKLIENLDFITKGLNISAGVSFNNFFRSYSNKSRQYKRFAISKSLAGDTIYTGIGQNTSLSGDESLSDQWRNFAFQSSLTYNRSFGDHCLEGLLIYNSDNYTVSGQSLPYKHVGVGGRLTYGYKGKYIGEFSFGYNGSENFLKGHRFGFFPAGSLAWVVSNEDFLKESKTINYLKIKSSYGLAGNDDIGGQRFMFDPVFSGTAAYYFGTGNASNGGLAEGVLANPYVTWEKEKKLNIGVEATLYRHFEVSLDLFNHDRYDILAQPNRTIPEYAGMNLPSLNVGKANNKGFELMLRYNSKKSNDFEYHVAFNTWYAKNKIVYNSEALQPFDYLYRTGHSIGQPFLLEAIGFFQDQADIESSPKQIFSVVQPGDIKYNDQNEDGIINQSDYLPVGNAGLPKLTLGLNVGFKYKRFDLDMLFQGVSGSTVYLSGNNFYAFQNNGKISEIALGRWTPETASTATYPRLSSENNLNNFQYSTFWQRDGSFIKLRSAELGYNLSDKINKKFHLDSSRIFINGTNLFTIDRIDYVGDPETMSGYPVARTISLGARLMF